MSDSWRPHELQHTRPPCPLPTPAACSSSGTSSRWCHPAISSSVIPVSSCLQPYPESGSFQMTTSASFLPMNIQDWFPLGLTGWISLQSKGLSRVFSNTTVQKHQFFLNKCMYVLGQPPPLLYRIVLLPLPPQNPISCSSQPQPQPLAAIHIFSVPFRLAFSRMSHTWNHTWCSLLSLASFA